MTGNMSNESRWREISNQVIRETVAKYPGASEKDLRIAISKAYPFGPRKYHPYKIWLSAVANYFNPPKVYKQTKADEREPMEGQLGLFE